VFFISLTKDVAESFSPSHNISISAPTPLAYLLISAIENGYSFDISYILGNGDYKSWKNYKIGASNDIITTGHN